MIGATASLSPLLEFGLRFLRTIVLLRLLTPREFGISVAIATLLAITKLASDLSLDKFVVIRGHSGAKALAAAHLISILRGLLLAAILFVGAPAVAGFLDAASATGSFQLVGLVLLVYSFANLRIQQMQFEYEYRPELMSNLVAQSSAVAVLLPLDAVFGDHRIIIGSFLTEAGVYVIASHLVARVPFSVRADWRTIAAALRFGLPLTVNGIGLAAAAQFDRLIVGHWLGVVALGDYALILAVGVVPISVLGLITGGLALPYLTNHREQLGEYPHAQMAIIWASVLLAAGYTLWVAVGLDLLVPWIFGSAHLVEPSIHALVTAIVFIKLLRFAPIAFLQASGRTGLLAVATLSGLGGIVAALALVLIDPQLTSVFAGMLLGDVVMLGLLWGLCWGSTAGLGNAVSSPVLGSLCVAFVSIAFAWLWSNDGWGKRGLVLGLAFSMWLILTGFGYRYWTKSFAARREAGDHVLDNGITVLPDRAGGP